MRGPKHAAPLEERRVGAMLLLGGVLPFGAAAALVGAAEEGVPCPFRAATGVPCPLCGGTRALALAARGDAGFAEYNAVWVAVAVAAVLAGAVAFAAGSLGAAPLTGRARRAGPRAGLIAVAVVVAAAWAWALAQRGAIAG